MLSATELNRRYKSQDVVRFEELNNGYIVAHIENTHASATIAMQGAHLTGFQPKGNAPLIWLSPEAKLQQGKSIRGGVPVCWPWFGPHDSEGRFPAHGFARTVPWRLNQLHTLGSGETRLEFELQWSPQIRKMWPYDCSVRHIITVGRQLRHELVTTNHGAKEMQIGQALHTYFQVADVRKTRIIGVQGCDYLDKVNAMQRSHQCGPISINSEVDRIYLDTPSSCEIFDQGMGRRIVIRSQGSRSTVVWNPWVDKAKQMGDLGVNGHLSMVCVETANAAQDRVVLAPGSQHRLIAEYTIMPL